jgi:glutathione synthase/RimK-type ligase-like ATP-grasp enzyme
VPALENPLPLLEWNSDKVYLAELAAAGIATVPTVFVSPGATVDLPPVDEWVVKPTVGAGSRGAGRFADAAAATAHITTLHEAGRVAMIQPYLAEVDAAGETALIYLDGGYSHAIEKGPMLPPDSAHAPEDEELFVAERISTRSPSAAERAVGDRVLALLAARFGAAPLYARVDLLPSPDGPVVVEVEVTEPSLFLTHDPAAADRFAAAIAARASVRR